MNYSLVENSRFFFCISNVKIESSYANCWGSIHSCTALRTGNYATAAHYRFVIGICGNNIVSSYFLENLKCYFHFYRCFFSNPLKYITIIIIKLNNFIWSWRETWVKQRWLRIRSKTAGNREIAWSPRMLIRPY